LATLASWAAAERAETAGVAGGVVFSVATIKVGVVIHRFMKVGRGSHEWERFLSRGCSALAGVLVITSTLA
jgi:hypothetical protein